MNYLAWIFLHHYNTIITCKENKNNFQYHLLSIQIKFSLIVIQMCVCLQYLVYLNHNLIKAHILHLVACSHTLFNLEQSLFVYFLMALAFLRDQTSCLIECFIVWIGLTDSSKYQITTSFIYWIFCLLLGLKSRYKVNIFGQDAGDYTFHVILHHWQETHKAKLAHYMWHCLVT
jgi:hypothetical protein